MTDLATGTLICKKKGKKGVWWSISGITKTGKKAVSLRCSLDQISSEILKQEMPETPVEYEFDNGGTPVRIRKTGEKWQQPQSATPPGKFAKRSAGKNAPDKKAPFMAKQDFYNPYNFIPAPPYKECEGLRQEPPCGHQAYVKDRYSGRIRIAIKAETPMLLLDTRNPHYSDNGHPAFDIRTDQDHPILTPTSLKGPLRAAYEAVTNSRMGVFNHPDALGRRTSVYSGLAMIPARVGKDAKTIELYLGSDSAKPWQEASPQWKQYQRTDKYSWKIESNTMYAAWLPQYKKVKFWNGDISKRNQPLWHNRLKYWGTANFPEHGDKVICWIQKYSKQRFDYWRVVAIAKGTAPDDFPTSVKDLQNHLNTDDNYNSQYSKQEYHKISGHVCITNQNAGNKHDERVFFKLDKNRVATIPLDETMATRWLKLVKDYKEKAAKGIKERNGKKTPLIAVRGDQPGQVAYSRHVDDKNKAEILREGNLVYARVSENGQSIVGLYPVMISRELANVSPFDLLDDSIKPGVDIEKLSPADRVFGWVRQEDKRDKRKKSKRGAYKGQLRICEVTPGDKAITKFDNNPLPLTILSTPKPEQFLFYGAENKSGMPGGQAKYHNRNQGLRGRKVYPHLANLPDGYWDAPNNWKQETPPKDFGGNQFREYLRGGSANAKCDNQNRSVTGWVEPGTTFEAEIEIANLTRQELGALLYILSFKDGFHKFGAAKPLGFGSAAVSISSVKVRSGEDIRESYKTLSLAASEVQASNETEWKKHITEYKNSISEVYGNDGEFADVSFIKAFETAMKGYSEKPVHYPRPGNPVNAPSDKDENFKWFMENSKKNGWLPMLGSDKEALPWLTPPERNPGRGNSGGNRQRNTRHR